MIFHQVEITYRGFKPELEREIDRVLRRPEGSDGSGMMIGGFRDLHYNYNRKDRANKAAAKLRKHFKRHKIKVIVKTFNEAHYG